MNEVNYFKQVFGARGAHALAKNILNYDEERKAEDIPEKTRAKELGLAPVQYRAFRALAVYIARTEEKDGRSEDTGVTK